MSSAGSVVTGRRIGRSATPGRPRSFVPARGSRIVIGLGAVIAAVVCWQLIYSNNVVDRDLLPSPGQVLEAGWTLASNGDLANHGWASLKTLTIGYVIAMVVGIPLGLLMGRVPVLHELFSPPISALYALPYLALIPLIIVALGTGTKGHGTIVFLGAFIPIVINAEAGARDVEPTLLRAARSFCASPTTTFFKVLVPAAAGPILAGASLGLGRGILAVVVAELFASTEGIGNLINLYGLNLNTPYLYFLVLFVGLVSFILTRILTYAAHLLGYQEGGQ